MNDSFIDRLIGKARWLQDNGQLSGARALLEEVVALAPLRVDGQTALGKVCGYLKDHPCAILHLETARQLELNDDLEALFTLGYEYCQAGRYVEAISCFDVTLQSVPDLPALHRWRGFALAQFGRGAEALQAYEEALRLKPDYDEVLAGVANLLFTNRRIEEAESYLLRALEIAPEKAAYHNDLGRVYRQQGRMAAAVDCFRKSLELEPDSLPAASNILYGLCYLDSITPEYRAMEHHSLARRFYPSIRITPRFGSDYIEGRALRIGYVSSDFGTHSVAFFLEPILIHHDREHFKIFCYSNRAIPDETTVRIKALDVTWRDIMGVPPESAAEKITEDGIDILVDLSGHTSGHRLDILALKPAPVQVSWIGYPHSTGLEQIDYYISDNLCDPPGLTDHLYSEKIWRLPRVFSCYLPPVTFPAVSQPPLTSNGYVTFGSFNNFAKVNDNLISLWASILRNIPNSRIVLKSASLSGNTLRQSVREKFADRGVTSDRLDLLSFAATTEEHLAQYDLVDIALDTFPYHGTTTTCEALWMGVPVVTLAGSAHLSRVGVSFMHALGLDGLIAESPEEYIACAAGLAGDSRRLVHLRENLRAMMALSPLMDVKGITKDVECAYQEMADRRGCLG